MITSGATADYHEMALTIQLLPWDSFLKKVWAGEIEL